ncbi:hypothetical protein [Brachyspira alvinipulli]|uniref:hypothetical protein n=1 Tax=Brachyspira alvinipulli TaxID=84379 RepID=UPI0004BC32C1|nr:hypothetical protein [Brachyspira alvinipulli]
MIRTESRYYIDEHIDIVKEIMNLKSYGLEIREIEKIIFENKSFEILFLSKIIKNKETLSRAKLIMNNIKQMENKLVISICSEIKTIFNINDYDFKETFNNQYLISILNDYKKTNLDKENTSILLLSLILLSLYDSYDNDVFDIKKFSEQFYMIIGENKNHT